MAITLRSAMYISFCLEELYGVYILHIVFLILKLLKGVTTAAVEFIYTPPRLSNHCRIILVCGFWRPEKLTTAKSKRTLTANNHTVPLDRRGEFLKKLYTSMQKYIVVKYIFSGVIE